jgi:hypothetical protein
MPLCLWRCQFAHHFLLWIYYAAQILLFGAEFTQVYCNTYGSRVQPQKHAVKVEVVEKVVAN